MIRIGIDAHNLEGDRAGVGRYLENLLMEWGKMPEVREQVEFVLYFKGDIPADLFLDNPSFIKKSLRILPRASFLLYFLIMLPYRAWRDKVDILFFPGYMIPWTYRGRAVLVSHDISFERFPHLFTLRYRLPYRFWGRYGAKMAKAIIAVSRFSKKEIVDLYHVDPSKVFVVPNGRDSRFVKKSEAEISFAKDKFGIRGEFVFFYGQIFNRRNVDKLILGFEKIANEFPNLQLLVVGKNKTQKPFIPIDEMVEDVNNRLGRKGVLRKEFIESNEDLIALCSGATVGAYLSTYEGFGLPPLEFLACGIPVLAPDMTALQDTLERKQVVIKDPSDENEIASAIKLVLTDPSIRAKAETEGPIQAKKFQWSDCARTTLAILKKAV